MRARVRLRLRVKVRVRVRVRVGVRVRVRVGVRVRVRVRLRVRVTFFARLDNNLSLSHGLLKPLFKVVYPILLYCPVMYKRCFVSFCLCNKQI